MAVNGNKRSGFFVRHRWLLWAVGIVGAVVLLASFMSHDDAVPIRSATVQPGTIRSIVSTNGKVEPLQSFEAHAQIGRASCRERVQISGAAGSLKNRAKTCNRPERTRQVQE